MTEKIQKVNNLTAITDLPLNHPSVQHYLNSQLFIWDNIIQITFEEQNNSLEEIFYKLTEITGEIPDKETREIITDLFNKHKKVKDITLLLEKIPNHLKIEEF